MLPPVEGMALLNLDYCTTGVSSMGSFFFFNFVYSALGSVGQGEGIKLMFGD